MEGGRDYIQATNLGSHDKYTTRVHKELRKKDSAFVLGGTNLPGLQGGLMSCVSFTDGPDDELQGNLGV